MIKAVILDDEAWAVRDIARLLKKREDIQIILQSTNPNKTMSFLKQEEADVLFVDIIMPGMTGLECTQYLHKWKKKTKVVIVSSYDDFEYMKEAIRQGVFDYLIKPVTEEDLGEVIDRMKADCGHLDKGEKEQNNTLFTQILLYIDNNFKNDIKLSDVAKQNYVSERYVTLLFDRYFEMSFLQYLTKVRMEYADELLRTTGKTVEEIGREIGYANGSYFSKVFRKYYNMTPNEVRKNDENE